MENDKLNDGQIYPNPTQSAQPDDSISSSSNQQGNPLDNQLFNTQSTDATNTQNVPLPTAITSSLPSNHSSASVTNSGLLKRITIILAMLIVVIVAIVTTLFLTGVIGEHRIEVGDYTFKVDENNWSSSIGQDGKTLVLMSKNNNLSGIGILPYAKEITYGLLNQEDRMKSLINQMSNVQFESQSEQTIGKTRCIVVNIKYETVAYANNQAIKAFCEGGGGTMFLIEVEGTSQAELNSNLSIGVDIINTAKHNSSSSK